MAVWTGCANGFFYDDVRSKPSLNDESLGWGSCERRSEGLCTALRRSTREIRAPCRAVFFVAVIPVWLHTVMIPVNFMENNTDVGHCPWVGLPCWLRRALLVPLLPAYISMQGFPFSCCRPLKCQRRLLMLLPIFFYPPNSQNLPASGTNYPSNSGVNYLHGQRELLELFTASSGRSLLYALLGLLGF